MTARRSICLIRSYSTTATSIQSQVEPHTSIFMLKSYLTKIQFVHQINKHLFPPLRNICQLSNCPYPTQHRPSAKLAAIHQGGGVCLNTSTRRPNHFKSWRPGAFPNRHTFPFIRMSTKISLVANDQRQGIASLRRVVCTRSSNSRHERDSWSGLAPTAKLLPLRTRCLSRPWGERWGQRRRVRH